MGKRKTAHTIKDHSDCELILLERTYNRVNRWDLTCVAHRTHVRWLSGLQAELIWDMVSHRQIHHKLHTW
jgi:hypothetical protein